MSFNLFPIQGMIILQKRKEHEKFNIIIPQKGGDLMRSVINSS